jgi:cyanate lyase
MSRDDVVKKIVATKVSKALKWSDVAVKIGLSKE